jgi:hypothetical protein
LSVRGRPPKGLARIVVGQLEQVLMSVNPGQAAELSVVASTPF